jgi:hypothetical protein
LIITGSASAPRDQHDALPLPLRRVLADEPVEIGRGLLGRPLAREVAVRQKPDHGHARVAERIGHFDVNLSPPSVAADEHDEVRRRIGGARLEFDRRKNAGRWGGGAGGGEESERNDRASHCVTAAVMIFVS